MRKKIKLLVLMLVFICAGRPALADDADSQKTEEDMQNYRFKTVTTPEGLNFKIPEDMPIETRNGLKAPIPYDEYLYFKFKKLEEKLNETSAKIDKMAASLEKIQKALEDTQKKYTSGVISSP